MIAEVDVRREESMSAGGVRDPTAVLKGRQKPFPLQILVVVQDRNSYPGSSVAQEGYGNTILTSSKHVPHDLELLFTSTFPVCFMSCSRLSASFASRFAGGVSSIVGNSANALCSTFLCRSAAPKMVGQSAQQRALHGASTVASIPRGKFGNRMQPTPFGCGLRGGVSLLARPMSAESSG
eukprot:366524-Rhodomonas_salina.1